MMDKDFLDSLKFLHRQYNRIVDDTSEIQSTSQRPNLIINKAKKIIETEPKDLITEEEIKNIEENTIKKYAQDLQKFTKPSETIKMCKQRIRFHEGDLMNVPNPKRKSVFTKLDKGKIRSIGDYKKIIEDMITETVNAPGTMRLMKTNCLKGNETGSNGVEKNGIENNGVRNNELRTNETDDCNRREPHRIGEIERTSYDHRYESTLGVTSSNREDKNKSNEDKNEHDNGDGQEEYYRHASDQRGEIEIVNLAKTCSSLNLEDSIDSLILVESSFEKLKRERDLKMIRNESIQLKEIINGQQERNDKGNKQDNQVNGMNYKENKRDDINQGDRSDKENMNPKDNKMENKNKMTNPNYDKINADDVNVEDVSNFKDLFVESVKLDGGVKPVLEVRKFGSASTGVSEVSDTDTSRTIVDGGVKNKKELRKYFKKWKNYTKFSAVEKHEEKIKVKIDNFLGNLEEKIKSHSAKSLTNLNEIKKTSQPLKSKSSLHFSSTEKIVDEMRSFQHRFQAQREIIEQQKQKLIEQKRIIEQMTLKKIETEAKESFDKCKQIYQTTASESKKYKYKMKLFKEELKVEEDDRGLKLNPMKAPKIVQIMEDRAKEREERRLLIQERKRLLDEEKKRQAEEILQKKKCEEMEEKHKKLLMLKQERELIRLKELQRKLEKKEYLENVRKALMHYRQKLLGKTIRSLRKTVEERQTQEEVACKFSEFNTTYKFFRYWKYYAREKMKKRIDRADGLYNGKLMRRTWDTWKESHLDHMRKTQVAQDLYEMKLQTRTFIAFHHLICLYHVQYKINLEKAKNHHRKQMLFVYINRWQTLPAINKIEREKNERRKKWRQKVLEILPDYNPVQED